MKLNHRDREALILTCNAIRNCKRYHVQPAPYFPLLVRMYHEIEGLGMIEWEECEGCEVPPYR